MNRLLAETLSALNVMLAITIIAGGALAAFCYPAPWWPAPREFLAVVGGLVGVVIAAVVCGLIAFLSLIERHLRQIAENAARPSGFTTIDKRREPTL